MLCFQSVVAAVLLSAVGVVYCAPQHGGGGSSSDPETPWTVEQVGNDHPHIEEPQILREFYPTRSSRLNESPRTFQSSGGGGIDQRQDYENHESITYSGFDETEFHYTPPLDFNIDDTDDHSNTGTGIWGNLRSMISNFRLEDVTDYLFPYSWHDVRHYFSRLRGTESDYLTQTDFNIGPHNTPYNDIGYGDLDDGEFEDFFSDTKAYTSFGPDDIIDQNDLENFFTYDKNIGNSAYDTSVSFGDTYPLSVAPRRPRQTSGRVNPFESFRRKYAGQSTKSYAQFASHVSKRLHKEKKSRGGNVIDFFPIIMTIREIDADKERKYGRSNSQNNPSDNWRLQDEADLSHQGSIYEIPDRSLYNDDLSIRLDRQQGNYDNNLGTNKLLSYQMHMTDKDYLKYFANS